MNFLAHLYLSGESPRIKVGNFIGDWVKGSNFENYPDDIRKGIIIHRHIDSFTDKHPLFKKTAKLFYPKFKRFSGIITDMAFDHILAARWENYNRISLNKFARQSYILLMANYAHLPMRVQGFLFKMILSRRLESYAKPEGIHNALKIMSANTILPDEADYAIEVIENHFAVIEHNFNLFLEEIIQYLTNDFQLQFSFQKGLKNQHNKKSTIKKRKNITFKDATRA